MSRLTLWYLNPLFRLGAERPLQEDDLPPLLDRDTTQRATALLEDAWHERLTVRDLQLARRRQGRASSGEGDYVVLEPVLEFGEDEDEDEDREENEGEGEGMLEQKKKKRHEEEGLTGWALPLACNTAFGGAFWMAAIWKLTNDLVQFMQPVMIGLLTAFVAGPAEEGQEEEDPLWLGLIYVAVLFASLVVQSVAIHQYFLVSFRTGMHLKAAVTTMVYRKALSLSNAARQETNTGAITNLMSADARRMADTIPYLQTIWSAPLQIGVSLGLLYDLLGPASLAGFAVMVLMIPVNLTVAHFQSKAKAALMAAKDQRVRMINEYLNGMRVIKLFAWETSFRERVEQARAEELRILRLTTGLGILGDFGWILTPILVSVATFTTYAFTGHALTNQVIFPAISIFNIIRFPITMLPGVISSLVSARVSVDRLQRFLQQPDLQSLSDPHTVVSTNSLGGHAAVELVHASFSWDPSAPTAQVLRDITLSVPKGALLVVVGSVGAGKSSLLAALLGEMHRHRGSLALHGTVAYVPQTSWMKNATIEDNILFGKTFDADLLQDAIQVSALGPDLQILPGGVRCEIGEKGINLSGGQKQRISLARAVYADADVYLFDDPLASVDPHVASHIFQKCILQHLSGKTRILVTHQLFTLPSADLVVFMEDGRIAEMGTFQDLMQRGQGFAELIQNNSIESSSSNEVDEAFIGSSSSSSSLISSSSLELEKKRDENADLIMAEERTTGRVELAVYRHFLAKVGYAVVTAVLVSIAASQALSIYSNYWLSVWAASTGQHSAEWYLGIFAALSLASAVTSLLGAGLVGLGSLTASRTLHSEALVRVFRATMSFFEMTPIGRILNRFSKDMEAIDTVLPQTLLWLLDSLATVVAIVLLTVVSTPVYLLPLAPLLWVFWWTANHYLATSRELKRLDSISNSPIYAHFSETLNGITTIRAYRLCSHFLQDNRDRIDANLRAYSPMIAANRWLGLRLESIGTLSLLCVSLFAVLGRSFVDPGLMALTLTMCLFMNGGLSWMVRMVTDTETQMNAVERLLFYDTIPQEAPLHLDQDSSTLSSSSSWPRHGAVAFANVFLRYRPDLPLVLSDLSAEIRGGERVGVCGRTGSGKSTLVGTLFRLLELESGSICIDGVDISRIGLDPLRRAVAIIPQDPTLFSGSLRHNLDPFGQADDRQIWDCLEKV
ncbi:MAG: ABC transporter transmembrane domain-containing protein, partial [archaeon]|nr:ABC transporter transmembrane domain-containing protein [archaeon]